MQFEVGQTVRIKDEGQMQDVIKAKHFASGMFFDQQMKKYLGQTAEIKTRENHRLYGSIYILKGCKSWCWGEDALELVPQFEIPEPLYLNCLVTSSHFELAILAGVAEENAYLCTIILPEEIAGKQVIVPKGELNVVETTENYEIEKIF